MPEETHRVKLPGTLCRSPFVTEFDTGTSIIPTGTQSVIFDRKHPLDNDVDMPVSSDMLGSFLKWIKQRKANKEQLTFDLEVYLLNNKGWLSKLFTAMGWLSKLYTVGEALESTCHMLTSYRQFYNKKEGVDWLSDVYFGKDLAAPLEIQIVNGLPQQKTVNCGAFVAAFAEYFIMEKSFPKKAKDFDIQMVRSRYAVSFWEYAMAKKKLGGAISDSEVTGRIYGRKSNKEEDFFLSLNV